MVDASYFYSLVSFIVLSVVIVLVYVFLSLYMKNMFYHLKKLIDTTDTQLKRIEGKIDSLPAKKK
ncbi:MAG TPA: hypothetical protein VJC00_02770 [Candidatus Nanoarchaeia archaeon]|nr:hypothetical protein [Candidatus Nanoarchaeia archaeon]